MSGTKTVVVAGAGATNCKATLAVNLALALAGLGLTVELRDADPDRHAARALTGQGAARVAVRGGAKLEILATPLADPDDEPAAPPALVVLDSAPRMDAATARSLRDADAVVVAVDGSALSLRALDEIVAVRNGERGGEVRVLLTRGLPRSVDRWALVERLTDRDAVRLSPATVPMGRGARRSADVAGAPPARSRRATLYAPGTRASRAYAAAARELVETLGVLRGDAVER